MTRGRSPMDQAAPETIAPHDHRRTAAMDTSRRGFLALAGASGVLGSKASVARQSRASWIPPQRLLDMLPSLMKLVALPGLSIAVVEAGSVVWSHAVGKA